ncbi:MAG: DUF3077 domain-containing protein [Pseudomonas sp.]
MKASTKAVLNACSRVEAGHDAQFVMEQAALLMGCVSKLTQHVLFEQDEAMVLAAHYLSGMAKALVEDVAHGMVQAPWNR